MRTYERGKLSYQRQKLLEDVFGKNYDYYLDEKWDGGMDIEISSDDDSRYYRKNGGQTAASLHIEYAGGMSYFALRLLRVGAFFPELGEEHEDEFEDNFDCSKKELDDELCDYVSDVSSEDGAGREDAFEYTETEFVWWDYDSEIVYIDITDDEGGFVSKGNIPSLDEINKVIKKMKKILDSHKKK